MAARPSREAREQAGRWRLSFQDRAPDGFAGERLARGTGSSLELQDRRAYQPGDDVRHLDWRALARTGQLLVKLHREEVRPRLELLLDLSRSMAVEEAKASLAVDLAEVLSEAARVERLEVRGIALGAGARRLEADELARGLDFDARAPLVDALREARAFLRPGSLRVLVSDCLCPAEARAIVRPLSSGAGGLALVQVLGQLDVEPPAGEALRLEDAESGEALELVLDPAAVRRYRARLGRLGQELELECRRAGARFARLVAGAPLARHCRDVLVPSGILAPA